MTHHAQQWTHQHTTVPTSPSAQALTCAHVNSRHTSFIHFISFHFISFHFISFHFISFHFISFHFISFHFISFHFMSCHVMSCHVMSCHVMSCHVMSCHVMSCHVMSCHVMSCHVISFHFISFHSFVSAMCVPCNRTHHSSQKSRKNTHSTAPLSNCALRRPHQRGLCSPVLPRSTVRLRRLPPHDS